MNYFEQNVHTLSVTHPELSFRLKSVKAAQTRYTFLESRTGEPIPAILDKQGSAHPLHSLMDPHKEAARLISTVEQESFLVLLGLGGAYYAEAALLRDDINMVLVLEYDLDGLSELLSGRDYSRLFANPRFRLFVDSSEEELKELLLNLYQPVLSGGLRVIPLRPRTDPEPKAFMEAKNAIAATINRISADYSVQAHFGKRWLSNIVKNITLMESIEGSLPHIRRAAVIAAGPSLNDQIKRLKESKNKCPELFLIATDTSLPCLLHEGIIPDAVISIDCQHISYYHFMQGLPREVYLFMDIVSPHALALFSGPGKLKLFAGNHPLTRYLSRAWKNMPELDTSGANVTYAALSLAELLGAEEIELYGADFSYPYGISYARGVYIYSIFEEKQNRFSPLESKSSAFLYRTPLEKKHCPDGSADVAGLAPWYYETGTLSFYREKLEEKRKSMEAEIIPIRTSGAPIKISQADKRRRENKQRTGNAFYGKTQTGAEEFLRLYKTSISKLPKAEKNATDYLVLLNEQERAVFTTMLPAAAAIKQRRAGIAFSELIEETKKHCLEKIEQVLLTARHVLPLSK